MNAGGARFERRDGSALNVIVVDHEGVTAGWLNSCPHRGTSLDLVPGRFLDVSGQHLVCATHGAVFDPVSGVCLAGPCPGARLVPVRLARTDGRLACLDDPDDVPRSAI